MPQLPASWLPWLALVPFVAAAAAPFLAARLGHRAGWVLAGVPVVLAALLATLLAAVADGETLRAGVDWLPSIGVRYALMVDGLSLVFALLVLVVGALILAYSGGYLRHDGRLGRFLALMLLFMGAMLGLVLSDDLVTLFVFYELTSIVSFLLIGFDAADRASRRGAFQALAVTGGGGLALLVAFLVITALTGQTSVSSLLADPGAVRGSGAYGLIAVLVIAGAFTKSAQVPFHSWLPNAMAAPTPVSAYLHSATMVKAGVFVLMRFNPVLGGTALWSTVLPLAGGTTLILGTLLALRERDAKLVLAYTTVASLGLMVLLVGVGADYAIAGAALYLLAHALFKGGLFMVAGAVDHEAGSRDITRLGGLARRMPVTFVAALLALLSMAGLPPFLGFVAKEGMYDALWHGGGGLTPAVAATVAGNALMVAVAGRLALPFLRPARGVGEGAHEAPPSLWLGPIALALAALGAGVAIGPALEWFARPMASAIAGRPVAVELYALPASLTPPVILSAVTIGAGLVLFALAGPVGRTVDGLVRLIGWGPDRGFDQAINGMVRGAAGLLHLIQPGDLRTYVRVSVAALALALLVPLIGAGLPELPEPGPIGAPYEVVVLVSAVLGLWIVVTARTRLVAIVCVGLQGTMVAIVFMLYAAPDLSLTQFMVEALSVVVLALVMTRLDLDPAEAPERGRTDSVLALACGAGFTLLLVGILGQPFDAKLADFYLAYAQPLAHGANVVNVILTDFRALDTLGEIAVVMAAGLGAMVLLRSSEAGRAAAPSRPPPMETIIFRTIAPGLAVLMAAFSVFVLLRGHDALGGGFVGGLVAASAAAIHGIARGVDGTRRVLRLQPNAVAGGGLALAAIAGLVAGFAGEPFLTGLWFEPEIAGVTVPLSTVLLFDVGVYLVVLGSVAAVTLDLEEGR